MAPVTDEKIVDEVVGRLATRYPGVGTDLIAKRAWAALKAFVNPTIRDFLPLLVERRVTRELKSGLPVARA
jgi:hypothetical protein